MSTRQRRLLVAIVALLSSPVVASDADGPPTLDALAFMVGSWSSERDGTTMEEWWTEPRGGVMLGLHRDVRPGKPAFFEYLRIEQAGAGPVYIASPRGAAPTSFPLVEVGPGTATFANPDHDFPQRIHYWKEDDATLCAAAEAERDGKTVGSKWCWSR